MKNVKMFGKSVPLIAILLIGLLALGASAALLTYYGYVATTVTVKQAILLDGSDYTEPVIETLSGSVVAGTTICDLHYLENVGPKPSVIDWTSDATPDAVGIEVLVLASVSDEYDTLGKAVEATVLQTWECSTSTWTIDIISDNLPHGVYGVGLMVSLDGSTKAFNVWYAEKAPELGVPSVGWYYNDYSGAGDVALPPGITASADGKNFEINIDCEYMCGAGNTYYWNLQVRTNLISWVNEPTSGFGSPVTGFITAYTGTEISFPYTLEPYETLDFNLAYNLSQYLLPDTYVITTKFVPVLP